jgi:predicted nuclease with TOPRIM domain
MAIPVEEQCSTELLQVLQRVSISANSTTHKQQAVAIKTLRTEHEQISDAVNEMRVAHETVVSEQTRLTEENTRLRSELEAYKQTLQEFIIVKGQIPIFTELASKVRDLENKKDKLQAIVR